MSKETKAIVISCVTPDVFAKLLDDELPERDESAVAEHVALCADCRATLGRLSDNPVLRTWARQCEAVSLASSDDPELLHALERLRQMPVVAVCHSTDGSEPPADSSQSGTDTDGQGPMLGHYRLDEKLGSGGMGIVWKAHDTKLNRTVAIKVLRLGLADDRARTRLLNEARAAAKIKHVNVVTVHGVESLADGTPYVVMEYVEGFTLHEQIKNSGRLEPKAAARICLEAAEGLAAAHAEGFVHRDIKPSNILLDRVAGRPKIADFGLARAMESTISFTREGTALGTPEYMSPEQLQSPKDVDERTDVYGLGVTLYESLVGEVPFRGLPNMVAAQVLADDPVPPRRRDNEIPPDLETITLKCMTKEASGRYQSAAELADDLRRWLAGEPIHARPVSALERAVKWARRRPAISGLLAAIVLITAVGFGLVTWKWLEAERRREQTQQEKERADRNFAYARQAVEEVTNSLMGNEDFRVGPFQDLQKHLLDATIVFHDDLVQQKTDDPSLEATLGRAYWHRGFVHQRTNAKDLALADYDRMQAIFSRLADRFHDNQEYRHLLAWSHCIRGNVLRDSGRLDEAETAYEKSRELFEELVSDFPALPYHLVKLGGCYMESGQLARQSGQRERAIEWYSRAIELLKRPLPLMDFPIFVASSKLSGDRDFYLRTACEGLADTLVASRRWQEAVGVFAERRKLDPENPDRWYDHAVANLGAGDIGGYREICAGMLEHFGKTTDPRVADRILYTCVTAPDAVPDASQLLPLAELDVKLWPSNIRILGAALYRAGKYEAAANCFEESAKAIRLGAWDWCFWAMVNSKLGRAEQARQCFDAGVRWIEEQEQKEREGEHPWGWTEQVESEQLRREAEQLINAKE